MFFKKGVTMNYLIRTCLCMTLSLAFCLLVGQVNGQTAIYRVTGTIGDLNLGAIPEVGSNETFVATFEIDLSVPDVALSSDNQGEYPGAILSSSIVFEGGYVSQVDFSGGTVVVVRDLGGGGIFLLDTDDTEIADGLGQIIVYQLDESFDSDALLSDPATQFDGAPESLFNLFEPTGTLLAFSDADLGPSASPLSFSVSLAEPETLLGDVDLSEEVNFSDIPPFITCLISGEYQTEADIDQNGEVGFSDIPPFIETLIVQ